MADDLIIRNVDDGDAEAIAAIYAHHVLHGTASYEVEPPSVADTLAKIRRISNPGWPFIVAELEGEVVGYAYGHSFRPRPAYMHSIEVSVYVRPGRTEGNIGTMLYEKLLDEIKKGDFHAVIGGISLPNDASVRLHEKFGFEKVAHFREVGRKFDRWIDVGYWELILDK